MMKVQSNCLSALRSRSRGDVDRYNNIVNLVTRSHQMFSKRGFKNIAKEKEAAKNFSTCIRIATVRVIKEILVLMKFSHRKNRLN
jgi:hypothetical protein